MARDAISYLRQFYRPRTRQACHFWKTSPCGGLSGDGETHARVMRALECATVVESDAGVSRLSATASSLQLITHRSAAGKACAELALLHQCRKVLLNVFVKGVCVPIKRSLQYKKD